MNNELEDLLDAHAEYYIKETMKFFQENGESPALSKNNEGDSTALAKLTKLISKREIEARIDELKTLKTKRRKYETFEWQGEEIIKRDSYKAVPYSIICGRLTQLTELQEGKNNE